MCMNSMIRPGLEGVQGAQLGRTSNEKLSLILTPLK